jgi:hypothetical protein
MSKPKYLQPIQFDELVAGLIDKDEKLKELLKLKISAAIESLNIEEIIQTPLIVALESYIDNLEMDFIDDTVKEMISKAVKKGLKQA